MRSIMVRRRQLDGGLPQAIRSGAWRREKADRGSNGRPDPAAVSYTRYTHSRRKSNRCAIQRRSFSERNIWDTPTSFATISLPHGFCLAP